MRWRRGGIAAAIGDDLQRLQLLLPFAEEKTIDARRCCSILHVSRPVLDHLRTRPLKPGSEETCLVGYNTMRHAPLRIDYDSLLRFVDHLRVAHGIPDRRPPLAFGRHRDDLLLPFPWHDTMTVEEVASVLNVHISGVLLRIEAGQFEAYQLVRNSPWRVSRSSLAKAIAKFGSAPSSSRPYRPSAVGSDATL